MANDMLKEFTKSKDARNAELYGRSEESQTESGSSAQPQQTAANPPALPAPERQTAAAIADQPKETAPFIQSAMRGRPISSAKTARISLAMEPELKEKFRVHCAIHHLTPSDVVDMLLREYLAAQKDNQDA